MVTGTNEYMNDLFRGEGAKTLYGKIYDIKDSDSPDVKRIMISLMTLKMFDLDWELIQDRAEFNAEEYHPFIYEYVCDVEDRDKIRIAEELFNGEDEISGWRRVYFSRHSSHINDMELILENGNLIISRSPVISRDRDLYICKNGIGISDKTKAKISKCDKEICHKIEQIITESRLQGKGNINIPANVLALGGTVYNVGMGNNIKIELTKQHGMDNYIIWFDMGASHKRSELNQPDVVNNMNSFKNEYMDVVILSHWDLDHIEAINNFDANVIYGEQITWIVPDPLILKSKKTGNISISSFAKRIIMYLHQKIPSQLVVINAPNSKVYTSNKLELFQGCAKARCGSKANNLGLIIKYDEYLFCGDCAYEAMPDEIKKHDYSFVVATHHGAATTTPNLRSVATGGKVVFSVGNDVKYPSKHQIDRFNNNGFSDIKNTRDSGNIKI